jgi:hypothetical protein
VVVPLTPDTPAEQTVPIGHPDEIDSNLPVFVCRVAVALLQMPPTTESMFTSPAARTLADEVESRFRDALASDGRILEVIEDKPEDLKTDNARIDSYTRINLEAKSLTEAVTPVPVLRLNSTISFRVRIPAKNQPKYRSRDDVPSDDYLVAWNGVTLAVQWEQPEPFATGSGGHVVLTILEEIGESVGYPVRIVACAPVCQHRFIHGDFVTFTSEDPPDHFHVSGETPVGSTVATPYSKNSEDRINLGRTFDALSGLVEEYGSSKVVADAIHLLEWRARVGSQEMLDLAYERVGRRRFPHILGALADTWKLRNSRRRTRELIAELWLALVSLDTYKVTWKAKNLHFEKSFSEPPFQELRTLLDVGSDVVRGQDLSLLRSATQEVSSRLEGRLLVIATLMGALGGVGGAALAALLT